MPEDLPTFDEAKSYLVSGKTLNAIIAAIKAQNITSIEGYDIERTPEGIRFTKSA